MHTALFVVGSPGVGKTSALRPLIGTPQEYKTLTDPTNGRVKWTIHPGRNLIFAGHYGTGTFDGSDTVPKDGAQACLDYWEKNLLPDPSWKGMILDGERFATSTVFERLSSMKGRVRMHCVYLSAPQDVLLQRRNERGSAQDPTWLRGRDTMYRNFANRFLPEDNELFDMFSDGEEESPPSENRLTEIEIVNISPEEVSRRISEVLGE